MRVNRRVFLRSALVAGVATTIPFLDARRTFTASVASHTASKLSAASPAVAPLPDEDGYDLWLRYRPVVDDVLRDHYLAFTARIAQLASGPIAPAISEELNRACLGMLGHRPTSANSVITEGTILIGTASASREIREVAGDVVLATLGDEGYVLKSAAINGFTATVIAANHERGLLYGIFALIKQMQLRQRIDALDIVDAPRANVRMVNHWDSIDRTVERGYAGRSIFDFQHLTAPNPRYEDYARALASVGINGTVINDVNASPGFLASAMIPGYVALAAIFRRWGIRLYLSANFACPIDLTRDDPQPITTADPLDTSVKDWWASKVAEIYRAIPDFGGFLVKANSEGDPGPLTYNRTHAQGANMLARALRPHGGIVIWRSFVHKGFHGWSEYEYLTFHPLDGQFDRNVIVQTKNGPIDFMVREPVNPLFGAMPRTNQMIELQITQEYTGHATHLCYLPSYWHWVLTFETHYQGTGPTVADIVDGTADDQPLTGFAGVINFGDDRNWTGSFLSAANTHGFARLAWDHTLNVKDIATEWVKLTFGLDDVVVSALVPMLLGSWRAYERYTSPFGVGYLMRPNGAHYEPDPRGTENLSHFTDRSGSGYDRTLATGSGFTRLYSEYWFNRYEHLETCPEELMMFMHIVPWGHQLANGKTTIQQMYDDHFAGAAEVVAMARAWNGLQGRIDHLRFGAVSQQFDRQIFQSQIWRDVLVSYYFDMARTISTSEQWIQLEMGEYPDTLRGGRDNDIPVNLTNASDRPQSLHLSFDHSDWRWSATDPRVTLLPRETRSLALTIKPPVDPFLGPVGFSGEPSGLAALGFDSQIMAVIPAPEYCTYAFDVGPSSHAIEPGYTALSSSEIWRPTSRFGWVGSPPKELEHPSSWDLLRDASVSDVLPRTIRLHLPSGKQRAWALVGGDGEGTQPIRLVLGGRVLAQTNYIAEGTFQWLPFAVDGGRRGRTVDLTIEGEDGRSWRLAALVVLKPGH